MQVTLLDDHPDISRLLLRKCWTAARTCYSRKTPAELWILSEKMTDEKLLRVVEDCLTSRHLSVLRHAEITYAVSGISRSCSHQLVRHHNGISFEQQSQRYVDLSKEDMTFVVPVERGSDAVRPTLALTKDAYDDLITSGVKPEIARAVLPNATPTNLVVTMNIEALLHVTGERLCTLAESEIRRLMAQIRSVTGKRIPWLKKHIVIKCMRDGMCYETRNADGHCGIRPHQNEVMAAYQAAVTTGKCEAS